MKKKIKHHVYGNVREAVHGTLAPAEVIELLELIEVPYIDFEGVERTGQLVIAVELANEIKQIFAILRSARFPIHSIIPIVKFKHDDYTSIAANNTSSFCYRNEAGTTITSIHSYGRAIDINPLLNPYLNTDGSDRAASYHHYKKYDPRVPGTVVAGGIVVKTFEKYGWKWGETFLNGPDYQHFEKLASAN